MAPTETETLTRVVARTLRAALPTMTPDERAACDAWLAAFAPGAEPTPDAGRVTYSKLRDGTWGVRGPAALLTSGKALTVERRDGTMRAETCGAVVWTDGTLTLARVEPKAARRARAG